MTVFPQFTTFEEMLDLHKYAPVPEDWFVFIADVRGSTGLIEEGRYKEVNYVGASAIAASLNAIKPKPLHYVFGGDGATIIAPPEDKQLIAEAMLAARKMAREAFQIDLRVGFVSVAELYRSGTELSLAEYRVSESFLQTVLAGSGVTFAESLVKGAETEAAYAIPEKELSSSGDFSGLECRWRPIKSTRGLIASVVIQSLNGNPKQVEKDYLEFIAFMSRFLGDSHPISISELQLSSGPQSYRNEVKLGWARQSALARSLRFFKIWAGTVVAGILWKNLYKQFGERYKKELQTQSDHRKFDGNLKMVLNVSYSQLEGLRNYLNDRFKKDQFVYGIHTSKTAIITCLVFNRSEGDHFHFVDGNDGGYALAAKAFKIRLKEKKGRQQASPLSDSKRRAAR